MRDIIIVASLLTLGACAAPNTQQLASMSDEQVCAAAQDWPMRYEVAAVTRGRGLRCHPAVVACDAAGFGPQALAAEQRSCVAGMLGQMKADAAREAAAWAAFSDSMDQLNEDLEDMQPPLGSYSNPVYVQPWP